VTKIYLASPVEPSGASWLINCFLALDIRVSHKPVVDTVWRQSSPAAMPDHMWQRNPDGSARLHPKASLLKKFLPILSSVDAFHFRDDVEVEYVQDLPTPQHVGPPVLYFVRDPRDSLYSAYCRQRPAIDYDTFLRLPDPDTLLNRPSHWRLCVESWIALTHGTWFMFEDYKRDAPELLRRVLEYVHIVRTAAEIERAVLESSFEKARAAEERYKAQHADDRETVNRSGRAGGWVDQAESRDGATVIESQAGHVMRRLGYECTAIDRNLAWISPTLARTLPIYSRIALPDSVTRAAVGEPDGDSSLVHVRAFAGAADEDYLRRTNLPNHRIRRLLENLELVAQAAGWELVPRLRELRQHFIDGSAHQFAQMRDLLLQQRRTRRHDEGRRRREDRP
jgi:hypothetical protein